MSDACLPGHSGPSPDASRRATSAKLNVFVSYSRDDLEFADQLAIALKATGFDASIDHESISAAEAWERRLGNLIRAADTVVFVLSPSSATSKACAWEVEQSIKLGKRIIPVACRPLGGTAAPPQLAELNYIFFYPEQRAPGTGFGSGLANLMAALDTDLDWLREHTRLMQRATEWDAGGRPSNRLLSGSDIAEAKAWVLRRPKDAPEPTALHRDFIRASENFEGERQSEERSRLEERERLVHDAEAAQAERDAAARRVVQRTIVGGAVALLLALVATGFGVYARKQQLEAQEQTQQAIAQRERAEAQSVRAKHAVEVVDTLSSLGWDGGGRGQQTQEEKDTDLFYRMQHVAMRGNTTAVRTLGQMTMEGRGVSQDHAKAREWFEKAAAAGDTAAMSYLAEMHFSGFGVPKDYTLAREWWEKAAALGNIRAKIFIGSLYVYGQGVPQDYAQAWIWNEKAAAGGDAEAMTILGVMLQKGYGAEVNYSKAREWYIRAAEAGSANAMVNLGNVYYDGLGVERDFNMSRQWYEKALAAGRPYSAAFRLGQMHFFGEGVAKNVEKAKELYDRSGAAGNSYAMAALGYLHQHGQGYRM